MQKTKNISRNGPRLAVIGVLGGAFFVSAPIWAAPQSPTLQLAQAEAVVLTVVARDGVTSEQTSVGKWDVGAIDSLSMPKVEKDFILRNDAKAAITIGRLQPTCGCTSVLLGEGTDTTKTLAPGEEVKVRMSVDVSRFHGPIHKAVRAYAADGATLLATMELDANIQDPITLSTRQVDFGRVNFGGEASFPLDITLSPRLVASAPQLVSSTPDILITPVEAKTKAAEGQPAVQRYNVALSKTAAIGPLNATLSLVAPPKAGTAPTEDEKRLADSLQTATIAVMGEVVGKLSIAPRMVVFGKEQTTQQVTISGVAAKEFKKLKVVSSSPFLKTRWITAKNAAPGATTAPVLELIVDPKAPVGALEANITITAPGGERLVLPVLVDVSAK